MPVSSVSEGVDDVQSVFDFCVNVVCIWFERHHTVKSDSKDFRTECAWEGRIA